MQAGCVEKVKPKNMNVPILTFMFSGFDLLDARHKRAIEAWAVVPSWYVFLRFSSASSVVIFSVALYFAR